MIGGLHYDEEEIDNRLIEGILFVFVSLSLSSHSHSLYLFLFLLINLLLLKKEAYVNFLISDLIVHICNKTSPQGGILVFLPGWNEISRCAYFSISLSRSIFFRSFCLI